MNLIESVRGVFSLPALSAAGWGLAVTFCACIFLVLTKRWHGFLSMDESEGIQKFHTAPTFTTSNKKPKGKERSEEIKFIEDFLKLQDKALLGKARAASNRLGDKPALPKARDQSARQGGEGGCGWGSFVIFTKRSQILVRERPQRCARDDGAGWFMSGVRPLNLHLDLTDN